jgi:5'-methylthioadenosine phosphorylase
MTKIGIIGGSGLYDLDGVEVIKSEEINTPFGKPSAPLTICELNGVSLFFIARHGPGHTLLPSEVNYRANIFALKLLGAEWCMSVSAVGSLKEEIPPGSIVIPDQFIDRTKSRADTFFGKGVAAHVSLADPVCPTLKEVFFREATKLKAELGEACGVPLIQNGGTYVCIEGPAFSTRAESNLYRSWGGDIIGMTNIPEAKLAREAEISYATLGLVTDYDCWHDGYNAVEVTDVLKLLEQIVSFAKMVVKRSALELIKEVPSQLASRALDKAFIGNPDAIPEKTREILAPLLRKL